MKKLLLSLTFVAATYMAQGQVKGDTIELVPLTCGMYTEGWKTIYPKADTIMMRFQYKKGTEKSFIIKSNGTLEFDGSLTYWYENKQIYPTKIIQPNTFSKP